MTRPRAMVFVTVLLSMAAGIFFLARKPVADVKEGGPAAVEVPAVFDCRVLRAQIAQKLEDANTCAQDGDCRVVSLGGPYSELGCHKYVHKSVNQIRLYESVERYYNSCYEKIDGCAPLARPVCVNQKCVAQK